MTRDEMRFSPQARMLSPMETEGTKLTVTERNCKLRRCFHGHTVIANAFIGVATYNAFKAHVLRDPTIMTGVETVAIETIGDNLSC